MTMHLLRTKFPSWSSSPSHSIPKKNNMLLKVKASTSTTYTTTTSDSFLVKENILPNKKNACDPACSHDFLQLPKYQEDTIKNDGTFLGKINIL